MNKCILFVSLILTSLNVFASNLVVELNKNVPDTIAHNIHGHLGALPNTNAERLLFIANTKKNVVNAIQALGYYRSNITIETIGKDDQKLWTLKIHVVLNQPTIIQSSDIIISGDGKSDNFFNELITTQNFHTGEVLNHGKYEKFKLALASLGLKHGYFNANFTESRIAIHQSFDTAKISIKYDTGQRFRLGDVNFSQVILNDNIVKQLIPFNYGESYHEKHLRELQNQLEQTEYFNNVVVDPQKSQSVDGIIPIEVTLQDAKKHNVNFGIGYATNTELRVSAGWKTPLVNRFGHKQVLKVTYSAINPIGQFNYIIPLTHPLNDTLNLDLTLEDDEFGDLDSTFGSIKLGRVQTHHGYISGYYLRFLQEDWEEDTINQNANYFLPGFNWSNIHRSGDAINPTSGFSQYYNIEFSHKNFGSDASFVRFDARWKYIYSFNDKHRLVTRAELGFIESSNTDLDDISPSLRFFTGGDQSIRGFSYQSIGTTISDSSAIADGDENATLTVGGTRLSIASIEYQYQFTEKWRGALFVDGGGAYTKENVKAVYSVGPGVHYLSPIGAVRLDFGYSLSKDNPSWRIHFNLGAEL